MTRSRRIVGWFGIVSLVLSVAFVWKSSASRPDGSKDAAAINNELIEALSGIDFVPPKKTFDGIEASALLEFARSSDTDAGLRIRAYRALAHYLLVDEEQRQLAANGLLEALLEHRDATSGVETLYLRAVALSFATVARDAAVAFILDLDVSTNYEVEGKFSLLEHVRRDVRADAAAALAASGSLTALPFLRWHRYGPDGSREKEQQVVLALDRAIQVLQPDL